MIVCMPRPILYRLYDMLLHDITWYLYYMRIFYDFGPQSQVLQSGALVFLVKQHFSSFLFSKRHCPLMGLLCLGSRIVTQQRMAFGPEAQWNSAQVAKTAVPRTQDQSVTFWSPNLVHHQAEGVGWCDMKKNRSFGLIYHYCNFHELSPSRKWETSAKKRPSKAKKEDAGRLGFCTPWMVQ